MAAKQATIFHQSFLRGGGMEHYALTLAKAFRELGWDVSFYGRKADPDLARNLGVRVRLSPAPKGLLRKFGDWHFYRDVARVAPGISGLQIALARVPVRELVICGGTHAGYLRSTRKTGGPLDWLQTSIEKRSYLAAARVVSHSDLCTSELRALYGIPDERLTTIYPPVDSGFSPGDEASSRRALRLPADKAILLFPSMGHGRKGLRALCEALKPLGDRIILAVAGKPLDTNKYPFVVPLGYVEDMPAAYRAADFTILGSWYEPFGLVGPESVLCGTRLLFEERIGCLAALAPDAALRFSIAHPNSIRAAVEEGLRQKSAGKHRLTDPKSALRYNADAKCHVQRLLSTARVVHPAGAPELCESPA